MADNLNVAPKSDPGDLPKDAKRLVYEYLVRLERRRESPYVFAIDDIYVVWFNYTLGYWKALISTTREDGRYYEVTHNLGKKETYIDTYVKTSNIAIKDPPRS